MNETIAEKIQGLSLITDKIETNVGHGVHSLQFENIVYQKLTTAEKHLNYLDEHVLDLEEATMLVNQENNDENKTTVIQNFILKMGQKRTEKCINRCYKITLSECEIDLF